MNVIKILRQDTGLSEYLFSADSFGSKRNGAASTAILLFWLILVIGVSARHEIGRDEARALLLAIEAPSWSQLPAAINNEGHPILWYAALRLAYSIFPNPVILKIVNLSFAFIAVLIFFRYSPFVLWQKILFIFGAYPVYEYSVICRNYAISMVFFFAFAALYPQRKQKPLLLALVLALLANANSLAGIFVGFLAAFWFLNDLLIERRSINLRRAGVLIASMFVIAAGIIFALAVSLPPHDTILTHRSTVTPARVMGALVNGLVNPGPHFKSAFAMLSNPLRDFLFYGLIMGLLIRPLAAATLWLGTAAMCTFFSTVYASHVRHQGVTVLFIITLYWIVYRQISSTAFGASAKMNFKSIRNAIASNWAKSNGLLRRMEGKVLALHLLAVYLLLTGIFVFHVAVAAYRVHADVTGEMSSNKAFAEFLAGHPQYDDAIIIGEPDYNLTSLQYYTSRQIYLPREQRFGDINRWTTSSQANLSLREVLAAAQKVKRQEQKPVLIALGCEIPLQQDSVSIKYPYGKRFTASPQELADFRSQTTQIAEFKDTPSNENWAVFLLH